MNTKRLSISEPYLKSKNSRVQCILNKFINYFLGSKNVWKYHETGWLKKNNLRKRYGAWPILSGNILLLVGGRMRDSLAQITDDIRLRYFSD